MGKNTWIVLAVTGWILALGLRTQPPDRLSDPTDLGTPTPSLQGMTRQTPQIAHEMCSLAFGQTGTMLEFVGRGAETMCLQWQTHQGFVPADTPSWASVICSFDFRGLTYSVREPGSSTATADYLCGVLSEAAQRQP